MKRLLFGVICAEANSIEQREILKGIIEQAQAYNVNIAVISNIYNPNVYNEEFYCENKIYDLILSSEFDGFILLSESFVNEHLQRMIYKYLLKQSSIPVIVVGTPLPNFNLPNSRNIDTSDEDGIEDITNHLIEEHGFTNLDFLTGYDYIEVSHLRLNGYKKALKKHGIPFDSEKVYYGNFWTDSGEDLAKKYIQGELPYPEAIICANDYMAYGMLDEFQNNGINIPEKFSVVGYDFVMERHEHTPLLTSYQKNREQLGKDAVVILFNKVKFNLDTEFIPPKGKLIYGTSCSCSHSKINLNRELQFSRTQHKYEKWNLFSSMEFRLTECRTLKEFIKIIGEFQYLVRYVQDMILCLYEDWYEYNSNIKSTMLICQSVMPWFDNIPFKMNKYQLSTLFDLNDKPIVYYFSPIFFQSHMFGHIVLKYDNPDTYDNVFRNWIKSISNSLEFLRMKNNIQYLMECQSLSETQDILTALNNDVGMEKAFKSLEYTCKDKQTLFCVILKVCLFNDDFSDYNNKKKIESLLDVASVIRQFGESQNSISGRVNDTTFICLIQTNNVSCEQLTDNLNSILTQHKVYMNNYGMDTYVCCSIQLYDNNSYLNLKKMCTTMIDKQLNLLYERRTNPHYTQMLEIRNDIYLNPQNFYSTNDICKRYLYSAGYLRVIYKNCFNISLYQDCINSRISMAKFLLTVTSMSVHEISERCGYNDEKYFLRQFTHLTGVTPKQYRTMMR